MIQNLSQQRGHIALISVHGDPAAEIGRDAAGGQNVYVRRVGEALAQLGWQVDMFTRRISEEQAVVVEHSPGCRTIRLQAGPLKFVKRDHLFEYLPDFLNSFLEYQSQTGVLYPIVHTNYWLSSWIGMELRKRQTLRQLHTYHSLGAVKYASMKSVPPIAETRLAVEKECLETVDCVVATSPQEQDDMRAFVSSLGNVDIVPCGTDTSVFGSVDKAAARQQIGFAPDEKVVLYVGRFDPRKGIETLVRAMAVSELRHIPRVRLVVVGGSRPGQPDGEEFLRIKRLTEDLGLADVVTFAGRKDHSQLSAYYAAADVCVVPSHYEPFGLVAIEAMASSTPVVASNVGGLKFTVVPEETGLLAEPQDVDAFAGAIARILKDEAWHEQLRRNSRTRVESYFSWDGVAAQLDKLYLKHLQELHHEFFYGDQINEQVEEHSSSERPSLTVLQTPAALTQTESEAPAETAIAV
jgi:D-inositol-3-phosphate glycosyltransferase